MSVRQRKVDIAILCCYFVDLTFPMVYLNLLRLLKKKKNLEDIRNKKEEECLGWDICCFVKKK